MFIRITFNDMQRLLSNEWAEQVVMNGEIERFQPL
jgi:hypothetical protein